MKEDLHLVAHAKQQAARRTGKRATGRTGATGLHEAAYDPSLGGTHNPTRRTGKTEESHAASGDATGRENLKVSEGRGVRPVALRRVARPRGRSTRGRTTARADPSHHRGSRPLTSLARSRATSVR